MHRISYRPPQEKEVETVIYLSAEQEKTYRKVAEKTLDHAMEHNGLDEGDGWSLNYTKQGINVYRRREDLTRFDQYYCTGHLNLSLENIMYGLYADNTKDQTTVQSILMENDFIYSGVITVIDKKNNDDPFRFLGIKQFKSVMHSQTTTETVRNMVFLEVKTMQALQKISHLYS